MENCGGASSFGTDPHRKGFSRNISSLSTNSLDPLSSENSYQILHVTFSAEYLKVLAASQCSLFESANFLSDRSNHRQTKEVCTRLPQRREGLQLLCRWILM